MIEAHSPELLYLLSGDPAELAEMLSSMRPVDVAEALSRLQPDAAAQLIKALPFDLVVQVFDEPELEGRGNIREDRCGERGPAARGDVRRPAGGSVPRAVPERA